MPVRLMQTGRVKEIVQESRSIKTFRLDMDMPAMPGQFAMVWVPGMDEKPISISYPGESVGFTVLKKGATTTKMHNMKEGDILGVRGPLGRGFKVTGEKIAVIGGGVGMAPLTPLVERAIDKGIEATVIIGSLTECEILFHDRLEKAGAEVHVCTDDGTCGFKGFCTDKFKEVLEKKTFDACYTCGPEIMMIKILHLAKENNIPAQVSMERYFKCGIGICGQCVVDDSGLRVCKEGPTFRDVEVENTKDFGKYFRDASGKRIYW
ncbi:MAG: dihydroorotate dehydrogenase electron transfer subunit [Candidatus Hydrothermarchaeales archaeon]